MILEPRTLTKQKLNHREESSEQQDFLQTIPDSRVKDQSLKYRKMQARVHRLHRLHLQTALASVTQPTNDIDSDVPRAIVSSSPGIRYTGTSGK